MKQKNPLRFFNISVFLQTQIFLLPVLLLFYQSNGLTVGDFFLFQGIFSLTALFLEVPMGYLADIFSKRNILVLSYTFFIIRLVLWLFFAHYGYWIILAGEVLYAAQKASFAGVADSYIYEYLKANNISKKMKKRYGKMNFFMSIGTSLSSLAGAGLYSMISKYTLMKYNQDYGFVVLILLELILNIAATGLLLKLPKVAPTLSSGPSLTETYKKLFQSICWTVKNQNIKYHMLYSGLLAATTLLFVWSFQPIMKLFLFPVSLYGLIYFTNHLFRALASLYADKISRMFPLSKIALGVFWFFVLSFIVTFILLNLPAIPLWVGLLYFIFISLTIGGQLVFFLLQGCRLHTFISSDKRATSSSVNTMIGRLYAGFFFILMKILLDGVSIQKSLGICFVVFLVAALPLRKVYAISRKEEQEELHGVG